MYPIVILTDIFRRIYSVTKNSVNIKLWKSLEHSRVLLAHNVCMETSKCVADSPRLAINDIATFLYR
jgi:hypothetical protein